MKKNLFFIIINICCLSGFSQSTQIVPNAIDKTLSITSNAEGFILGKPLINFGTFVSADAGWIQSYTNHSLSLANNGDGLVFNTNFTTKYLEPLKLGTDAPAIKIKSITGFYTANTVGGFVTIPFVIGSASLIGLKVTVNLGPAGFVAENYRYTAGYEVNANYDGANIYIYNVPGNSINILNKPLIVTLTTSH
jgi:hypothetical protein